MDSIKAISFWIIDPNNLTAISTLVIAGFTAVLAWVGYCQSRLIRRTVELGRQEFIAAHRPRIIVRFIQGPLVEAEDTPQVIWITVVNIGVNKATILEWGADLARRKGKTWVSPGLDAGPKAVASIVLISGERHTFTVTAKTPYDDAKIFADAWDDATDAAEREELCAVGVIRYADESGIVRETGFFRVYESKSEAFVPSKNPGEEYQD